MTILENIALGLSPEDASKSEECIRSLVVQAAKNADAHDFIMSCCENRYNTPVGQGGIHLSGGQRQRITIARALASQPRILICDEITAALDANTEAKIMSTIYNIMEKRSVLVIAHRLSTIRYLDEILVLEGGKVIERGNHEELMSIIGGSYYTLVRSSEASGNDVATEHNTVR
eukprot:CAMPEP_0171309318 /NCGR_PEP_ID=MMETSP0816-20121228/19484_1 /TAXON_ID=420281 /ORGANISM="Proboscia inermis, Strain CCAP1064/1" /LENGTH=173 /DNA_ID=CAMNT_0011792779 /DNA_START=243 /DNA_END=764 /DNA_ORIENTATION=+